MGNPPERRRRQLRVVAARPSGNYPCRFLRGGAVQLDFFFPRQGDLEVLGQWFSDVRRFEASQSEVSQVLRTCRYLIDGHKMLGA